MKKVIVIFAKTISESKVKTRLGKTIGDENAKTLYLDFLWETDRVVKNVDEELDVLWVINKKDNKLKYPWNKDNNALIFSEDNLKDLLWAVYESVQDNHSKIIFMGSDSPHIPKKYIQKSLSCDFDYYLGPCTDGGYYLFSSSSKLTKDHFDINYSSETTYLEFKKKLEASGRLSVLDEFYDLDTQADVERFVADDSLRNTLFKQNTASFFQSL